MLVERRKLAIGGPVSLRLTIPKQWSDKHKLEIGDEVEIIADDILVVFPLGLTTEQKVEALRKMAELVRVVGGGE